VRSREEAVTSKGEAEHELKIDEPAPTGGLAAQIAVGICGLYHVINRDRNRRHPALGASEPNLGERMQRLQATQLIISLVRGDCRQGVARIGSRRYAAEEEIHRPREEAADQSLLIKPIK
jgi:hypothetical protein